MFRHSFQMVALSLALAVGYAAPIHAQSTDASTTSAEDLKQLFKKQKTRGLSLVPSTVAPENLPTVSDEAGTQVAPVAYSEIDKSDQVNVRITFDFDSALLRADEKPKLATLCEAMKDVDVQTFRIIGHTDAKGTEPYNEKLSLLRAQEVKRYLINDCGIDAARLEAVGVGKRFLFNTANPDSEENRRVEFQALS